MTWVDFDQKKNAMITPNVKITVEVTCVECGDKIPVDHISMPGNPDVMAWVPPCPICAKQAYGVYKKRMESKGEFD